MSTKKKKKNQKFIENNKNAMNMNEKKLTDSRTENSNVK